MGNDAGSTGYPYNRFTSYHCHVMYLNLFQQDQKYIDSFYALDNGVGVRLIVFHKEY